MAQPILAPLANLFRRMFVKQKKKEVWGLSMLRYGTWQLSRSMFGWLLQKKKICGPNGFIPYTWKRKAGGATLQRALIAGSGDQYAEWKSPWKVSSQRLNQLACLDTQLNWVTRALCPWTGRSIEQRVYGASLVGLSIVLSCGWWCKEDSIPRKDSWKWDSSGWLMYVVCSWYWKPPTSIISLLF